MKTTEGEKIAAPATQSDSWCSRRLQTLCLLSVRKTSSHEEEEPSAHPHTLQSFVTSMKPPSSSHQRFGFCRRRLVRRRTSMTLCNVEAQLHRHGNIVAVREREFHHVAAQEKPLIITESKTQRDVHGLTTATMTQ